MWLAFTLAACEDKLPPVDSAPVVDESATGGEDSDAPESVDLDGDGYAAEEDCDDDDGTVHPDADELCDGLDQDCDGAIDEGLEQTWYLDEDGDGYGAGEPIEDCAQPSNHVSEGGDCDDADDYVNPTAHDVCGDGIDHDCDGDSYACAAWGAYQVSDALASWTLTGERENDGVGHCVAPVGDLDGDGSDDIMAGAPGWYEGGYEGAGFLFTADQLLGSSGRATTGEATAKLSSSRYSYAFWSFAGPGDMSGDGIHDVLVGAGLYEEDDGSSPGRSFLALGPITSDRALDEVALQVLGEPTGLHAGEAVSAAGDTNGTGSPGVLIADPNYYTDDTYYMGAVYLVTGPVTADVELEDATARFYTSDTEDRTSLGYRVAGPGDVDGDGFDDVLMGAFRGDDEDAGEENNGRSYLYFGPVSGTQIVEEADHILIGEENGDSACIVSEAGDVDGDGLDDLLIGAPFHDDVDAHGEDVSGNGAAYLVHARTLTGADQILRLEDADARFSGPVIASANMGYGLAGPGDLDGNGYDDLLVGAPYDSTYYEYAGAVFVWLGPVSGQYTSDTAHGTFLPAGTGVGDGEDLGWSLSGIGDFDLDGHPDFLIGAPDDGSVADDAGAIYVMSTGDFLSK